MINDGIYECKATGVAEYGVTDTGTDQIAVEVEIYGPEKEVIETRSTYLSFTEKAAPYAIDKLRALGFNGDSLADLVGLGSKVARCSVKTEEYQGKMSQKVDVFGEKGPAFKNAMSPENKRQFAARFNNLLSAPKGAPRSSNGGGGGKGNPPAGNGSERFDDIPF